MLNDLYLDLPISSFGGALVEEPGASHDHISEMIYLNQVSNLGRTVLNYFCHFDIVVGDGSCSLEHE